MSNASEAAAWDNMEAEHERRGYEKARKQVLAIFDDFYSDASMLSAQPKTLAILRKEILAMRPEPAKEQP